MKNVVIPFVILMLTSCKHYETRWEEIKGIGVSEKEVVTQAIYFEDSLTGVIGGSESIYDTTSTNFRKIANIPILYLTENGGKNWRLLNIDKIYNDYNLGVDNVKLKDSTIICQIDSVICQSNDLGLTWKLVEKSNFTYLREKYFPNSTRYNRKEKILVIENRKFYIQESHEYKNTEIVICTEKSFTPHYYFISRDNGNTWDFLQSEFASNKRKFLLKDEYLFAFDMQYGLQKLQLK